MNAGGSLPSGLVAYDQYGHPHRRLVPAASWPEPLNTVFDARSIDGTELQPNSAATTATSATLLPSGENSPRSSGSAPDSERPQDENGPSSGDKASSKKRKKAKEKVPLAIDQPLTSQGKERVRVYLACAQWCVARSFRLSGGRLTSREQPPAQDSLRWSEADVRGLHQARRPGMQLRQRPQASRAGSCSGFPFTDSRRGGGCSGGPFSEKAASTLPSHALRYPARPEADGCLFCGLGTYTSSAPVRTDIPSLDFSPGLGDV
jgi:hypothetical protein